MRILGADLPRESPGEDPPERTIVLLDEDGRVAGSERVFSLPAVAAAVGRLAAGEPFLLGVNVPVVVPAKSSRARTVENVVRRRFGIRLPPGGRASLRDDAEGVAGETLLAGLAAAGQPCLPYPDRDLRQPGLAETHPALIVKSLLWESSPLAASLEQEALEPLFRAYEPPPYRTPPGRARRRNWAERAANMDLSLRALGEVRGFDFEPARRALSQATSDAEMTRAAGLLDATLIAGTAKRYVESPETCLFLGDREQGYLILPADGLVRRLALSGTTAAAARLFPRASLRERLGSHATLRAAELLAPEGRAPRIEAIFREHPRYEFDNVDEMLWWKHCRHLAGPVLPTEGLHEMVVVIESARSDEAPLKLRRSRHRTLSFRFDPPAAWRTYVPTRDGKVYPIRVLRAVYETLPAAD